MRFGLMIVEVPFKEANLRVPTECLPWPADRMKRVTIDFFVIGGSNAQDSAWYDLSISSLDGLTWVRHCFGQVKAGFDAQKSTPSIDPQKRAVSSQKWYNAMKHLGLEYGLRFSGMTGISTDPVKEIAVATVQNDVRKGEKFHTIHALSLDCTAQLFSVAAYHGLQRLFISPAIFFFIEELCVQPPRGEMTTRASVERQPNRTMLGDLLAVSKKGELSSI